MKITLLTYDIIDSTNTEALKQARMGADEGLCIIARQQTAGRGRHGRVWVSEKDAGLYFSIVLRPKIEMEYLPLITLMSGVAVHDILREFGLRPDIKWVNDIHVNNKKIGGILAETTETDKGLAVIVGIGINIRSSNYSPEIADIATSIENESDNTFIDDSFHETLAASLIRNITVQYQVLSRPAGHAAIKDEWSKRSTYFMGKSVNVMTGDETLTGITEGIEDNGSLRLRLIDGNIRIIHSGEVSRVRAKIN